MMESKMLFSKLTIFLVISILLCVSPTPAFAAKKSYIVYMGTPSHKGRKMSEKALGQVSDSHCKFLASFLGSTKKAKDSIFYSYQGYINGFAAVLDEEQAAKISKDPNVVSVFKNELLQLHTTKSWNFLSLENNNGAADLNSLWTKAKHGEDIIIGNLDSGVIPELESFSDKGYGPIPKKWNGICQNGTKIGFACNKKLIGARYFYKGFLMNRELKDHSNFSSPRDDGGHGTHTLSTAGGNIVPGANILGAANGIAKGGAPRARVAAYKVCWPPVDGKGGCSEADILKAFDQAIRDGVDVLSVSLGSVRPTDYVDDATSIGAFHAAKHGILVVASAGNEGPGDSTLSNPAPWILTVAASTMDREIVANVELGNGARFKGAGVFKPMRQEKPIPILTGAQAKAAKANEKEALFCKEGALDPQKAKGKIVVCLRGGEVDRADKSVNAARAGAVGMILCNDKADGDAIVADPHTIPASHLNYTAGQALFAYINSTQNPQATIKDTTTQLNTKPAPVMAAFSSKGPNIFTPEILKPDITAPGVSVLAAFGLPISGFDKQTVFPFNLLSGTSMSCPHVSGIAALLKAIHPDWSPAAIKSAIMTTASTIDNTGSPILNSSNIKATPFSYGAGHVQPNLAADPGLVYDMTPSDYKKFLCASGYETHKVQLFAKKHVCPNFTDPLTILNLNYPSITVPELSGSATVRRTLKNVGPPGNYKARVVSPQGFSVIVKPDVFKFTKGGEQKTFSVTLKEDQKNKKASDDEDYSFGELIWSDGVHNVRSPIVVAKEPELKSPNSKTKE
ncbi:subtilisin-like protease SBT5.4 [Cornus florida]|uniref:subtilisin-like protease SBT5.4 n=1 Tax=Cornus florida TaxID=4283 RepID=UPI002897790E|nr:subtilisin-like protease SBT5.4 [Cornus florida]